MLLQFTNSALLLLYLLLSVSGFYVLVWPTTPWVMDVHLVAGWSLVALIPWKALISYRSLKRGLRPSFDRGVMPLLSALLAGAVVLVLSFGLAWMWNVGGWLIVAGQTIISWHWVLGLAALPLLALHAWRNWPNPRREILLSRRGALRGLALAAAGAVGWQVAETLAKSRAAPDRSRSPATGSREFASFEGNAMPVTTNPGENPRRLQAERWRLELGGAVDRPLSLAYSELLALPPAQVTATLDCTVGWFSHQTYQGIPLPDLLTLARPEHGARYVRLVSDTGYAKTFTKQESERILLATHIGGEPLTHPHGYPLRAVIPPRRGWFWVKWLTRVELLTHVAQPLPKQPRDGTQITN